VIAWEKVILDLAASAGVTVSGSRLLSVSGHSVLLIDRFDRTVEGLRIGYVSARTLLRAGYGMTNAATWTSSRSSKGGRRSQAGNLRSCGGASCSRS